MFFMVFPRARYEKSHLDTWWGSQLSRTVQLALDDLMNLNDVHNCFPSLMIIQLIIWQLFANWWIYYRSADYLHSDIGLEARSKRCNNRIDIYLHENHFKSRSKHFQLDCNKLCSLRSREILLESGTLIFANLRHKQDMENKLAGWESRKSPQPLIGVHTWKWKLKGSNLLRMSIFFELSLLLCLTSVVKLEI